MTGRSSQSFTVIVVCVCFFTRHPHFILRAKVKEKTVFVANGRLVPVLKPQSKSEPLLQTIYCIKQLWQGNKDDLKEKFLFKVLGVNLHC